MHDLIRRRDNLKNDLKLLEECVEGTKLAIKSVDVLIEKTNGTEVLYKKKNINSSQRENDN